MSRGQSPRHFHHQLGLLMLMKRKYSMKKVMKKNVAKVMKKSVAKVMKKK